MKVSAMKNLVTLTAALICSTILSAQIVFEHENWSTVKERAKAENKIVFVDAYTTWCGPCKWMAKNVFTDPQVGEFYNKHFINLKLDMEKGEGLDFADAFQVNAYPTLLFVDGDGKVLHKHLGAVPADQFLGVGRDAISPEKRISAYQDKYDAMKDDPEFVRQYLIKMLGAGMHVREEANAYFASLNEEEVATQDNFVILQILQPSLGTPAFDALLTHRKGFTKIGGQERMDALLETIMNSAIYKSILGDDPAAYPALRAEILKMNLAEKERLVAMGDMEYDDAQGDMDAYLDHAKSYSKTFLWNDWNELNSLAWDMYLNKSLDGSQMKLAKKVAKRAVKLEANYYTTDTYAAVLYKSGKYAPALKWADTAIDLAKASDSDYSITTELIEQIKSAME